MTTTKFFQIQYAIFVIYYLQCKIKFVCAVYLRHMLGLWFIFEHVTPEDIWKLLLNDGSFHAVVTI